MTLREGARAGIVASYLPRLVIDRLCTGPGPPSEPSAEAFRGALLMIDITGFTSIVDAAATRGAEGAEQLSRLLSAYLGGVIDVIEEHGGDVAKVVGDALIPVWPASAEDVATATVRAAACGQDIAARFGDSQMEEGLRLSLKIGICSGDLAAMSVGGLDGRWLFLITGQAVSQLRELQPLLESGEVIASPEAWSHLDSKVGGRPVGRGHVRLDQAMTSVDRRPRPGRALSDDEESAARTYIPPVLLARLDAGQADWLAELRDTTVLFTNVAGVAAERLDGPADVGDLQAVAALGQQVLRRYGGWLKELTMDDKGTTLIGVLGVPPFTHEDDPARAVAAALALHGGLHDLGLSGRTGIATGLTFCGPWGNARRREFAMLGGHLNLAARLMQAAAADAVLCDARTRQDVVSVSFDRLPGFVLKGLSTPVDVYRARPSELDPQRSERFVDRSDELATLTAFTERLVGGQGGLVVLEGEPGIGKSRLVAEWLARAHEVGVEALLGSATEIDSGTPYHPWRGVFERLLGLQRVADPGPRSSVILERLSRDETSRRLAPLLAPVLGADLPDNDATRQMSGAVRADNTRDLLVRLLRQRAAEGPLLVVLEDAQWFDSASWSLVARSEHEVGQLLIGITTRPVAHPRPEQTQLRESASLLMALPPLTFTDAVVLAALRSGATTVDERIAAILRQRAEGNPLFIEQLTVALRDAGRIVVDHGLLRAADETEDLDRSIIPDSVQRVITARLDQLSPELAMVLKVASVIGQQFQSSTLERIHPVTDRREALADDLDALARLDLIGRLGDESEDRAFEFRHTVTREVAYNLMPSGQTRQLHLALAEWYEETAAADAAPNHSHIAHHWIRAGHPDRAVGHLGTAGAQALRTFANEEAIDALEQALTLDTGQSSPDAQRRRARWHLQAGEAYVNLSRYREGREHIELGLGLLGSAVPKGRWRQGASLLGQTVRQVGHRVGFPGRGWLRDDSQREVLVAVCRAYERLAEASYYSRETLLPLYCVVRILNEAEASGSAPEIARGLAGSGALFGLVPFHRVAHRYLAEALDRLGDVDDLETHEIVRIVVGFYHAGVGGWASAREQFTTVRSIAEDLGDQRRFQDAIGNLAEIASLEGSFELATELTDELLGLVRARGDRRFEGEALAIGAYCAWQRGEPDVALDSLTALRAIADKEGLPDELLIKFHGIEALVRLDRGDRAAAMASAAAALRLTEQQRPTYATYLGHVAPSEVYLESWESGDHGDEVRLRSERGLTQLAGYARIFAVGRARASLLRGRRAWLLGKHDDALRHWRHALDQARTYGMPYEEGLAHRELGDRLPPEDEEQTVHVGQAKAIFERLGAVRDARQLAHMPAGAPQDPS